jgi:hypothetical protein
LNYTNLPSNSTVTVEEFDGNLAGTPPAGRTLFTGRYWTVTESSPTNPTYNITLDGAGLSVGSSDIYVLKDGTNPLSAYLASPSGTDYTANGLTGFSSFALAAGCDDPTIDQQPTSPAVVCKGIGTASFSVQASGPGQGSFSYQWQESTTGPSGTFNNISNGGVYSIVSDNAGNSTLTITNPPGTMNGYAYRVIINRSCGGIATTNGNAVLTVDVLAPTITAGEQQQH